MTITMATPSVSPTLLLDVDYDIIIIVFQFDNAYRKETDVLTRF